MRVDTAPKDSPTLILRFTLLAKTTRATRKGNFVVVGTWAPVSRACISQRSRCSSLQRASSASAWEKMGRRGRSGVGNGSVLRHTSLSTTRGGSVPAGR